MIPPEIRRKVEESLSGHLNASVQIGETAPVAGGCIHNAQRLETNQGAWFLKFNRRTSLENFQAEIHGLGLLRSAEELTVPEPLEAEMAGPHAYLLMQHIRSAPKSESFWQDFGQGLAALHRHTQAEYGLDRQNYIGALDQDNRPSGDWVDFFVNRRLQPQVQLARRNGILSKEVEDSFLGLYKEIRNLVPEEPPSLLHGDLWSGNFMVGDEGEPVLIDPAVYYGHREAEIAFTRMFGGFAPEFYQSYQEAWPLQAGWESRVELFNLYPLMVHVNLFGGSYVSEVQQVLGRLGQ